MFKSGKGFCVKVENVSENMYFTNYCFANCETIVTVQTNFIFEFACYQGQHVSSY